MAAEEKWEEEFTKYWKQSSIADFISDIPDNAYNLEKGTIQVSKLTPKSFVPFRRFFSELPFVSVWLVFKYFEEDLAEIGEEPKAPTSPGNISQFEKPLTSPPQLSSQTQSITSSVHSHTTAAWVSASHPNDNNYNNKSNSNKSNNNNNKSNNNNNNNISPQISPKVVASKTPTPTEIFCYKFQPGAYQASVQGITVRQSGVFSIEPNAEIHYVAYNRTKPVDPSFKKLVTKVSVGGSDVMGQVREWVEAGNYISTTNTDEQSLLHIACQYSQDHVAKYVVEKGIDLETRDKNGWTPLLCAIQNSNLPLADFLVRSGALTLPIVTTNGSSIFHYLVRIIPKLTELEMYLRILDEGAKAYGDKTCLPNFSGETPLHRAAIVGNLVALKWILDEGRPFNVDSTAETGHGDTVLHHAVKSGNPKVVSFLINHFRIDVPARFPPNSPYNLAVKLQSAEIANLFPIEAKLRLGALTTYLLQCIVDFLDVTPLMKCSRVNHKFNVLVKNTLYRKYKGRSPDKIQLWHGIDRANALLSEDLKHISSPQFLQQWNAGPVPADAEYTLVKIVMAGPRRCGATTLLQTTVGWPVGGGVDFVIKHMGADGDHAKLQIWDKMYRAYQYYDLPSSYLRAASLLIIMYDPSDRECKSDMIHWMRTMDRFTNKTLVLFIATHGDRPCAVSIEEMSEHLKEIQPGIISEDDMPGIEWLRFPYIVQTRIDDPESMHRAIKLASYMAIRMKKSVMAGNGPVRIVPPRAPPPKKSLVSTFKNLFK